MRQTPSHTYRHTRTQNEVHALSVLCTGPSPPFPWIYISCPWILGLVLHKPNGHKNLLQTWGMSGWGFLRPRDSAFSNSLRCGKVKRPVSFPHHGCCSTYTYSIHPTALHTDKSYGHKSSHKPPHPTKSFSFLPLHAQSYREKERRCHHHGAFGLPTHRLVFYASPGTSRHPTRHPLFWACFLVCTLEPKPLDANFTASCPGVR